MNVQGTYQATARGFGFFTPEGAVGREADLFVPPRCDGGAWTGDKVTARVEPDPKDPQRQLAKITAVVERTNRTLVGAVERRGREVWLRPTSDRYPNAVKVVGRSAAKLKAGDKIAVAVTSYGSAKLPPMGTFKCAFGREGTREAAVAALLYEHGIDTDFPAPVTAAAQLAPQEVDPAAWAGRLDLRDKTVITIDGASSKDFDDAVSLEKDGEGHWVLGVHIADVSHYVAENSPLDLEAFHRGTSVYFADRVVPMLPEALSNGICSLNPHVDRLALSCVMTMDAHGHVLDHRIIKTVLRSTERMTYDDCNLLLKDQDPALAERYAHILPMLRDMAGLAKALEKGRRARGALDLESQECYIVCDESGAPVDIRVRETGESEKLIESFMLAANECVAEHLKKAGLPAVYRVHEKPSEDKVTNLKAMLSPLGIDLKQADNGSLQKVLEAVKGTPQAPAVHTMVLRSLMKARYDTENLGLADGCWTVSQRDKILFKQSPSDNNRDLGNWVEEHYTGVLPAADCAGIDYQLYVRHREYSGDGQFLLQLTYMGADNGKDAIYTYMGKRFTLRGIPANNDATVWQLVSDNGENTFNFLYGTNGLTLTLLNNRFETPKSELDYSLKKAG